MSTPQLENAASDGIVMRLAYPTCGCLIVCLISAGIGAGATIIVCWTGIPFTDFYVGCLTGLMFAFILSAYTAVVSGSHIWKILFWIVTSISASVWLLLLLGGIVFGWGNPQHKYYGEWTLVARERWHLDPPDKWPAQSEATYDRKETIATPADFRCRITSRLFEIYSNGASAEFELTRPTTGHLPTLLLKGESAGWVELQGDELHLCLYVPGTEVWKTLDDGTVLMFASIDRFRCRRIP